MCYALALVTLIYTLVQVVINGTLENPAATERPLADAARHIFGGGAAAAIAAGALVSIYGYLGANMLHTPRLTFALAERGDFPRFFAAVHPKFRTPHVSIMLYTALLLAFTLARKLSMEYYAFGGGAVADVFLFCRGAAGVAPQAATGGRVSVPAGSTVAIFTLAFCGLLFTQTPMSNLSVVLSTIAIAGAELANGSQERSFPWEALVQIGKRFTSRFSSFSKFQHAA